MEINDRNLKSCQLREPCVTEALCGIYDGKLDAKGNDVITNLLVKCCENARVYGGLNGAKGYIGEKALTWALWRHLNHQNSDTLLTHPMLADAVVSGPRGLWFGQDIQFNIVMAGEAEQFWYLKTLNRRMSFENDDATILGMTLQFLTTWRDTQTTVFPRDRMGPDICLWGTAGTFADVPADESIPIYIQVKIKNKPLAMWNFLPALCSTTPGLFFTTSTVKKQVLEMQLTYDEEGARDMNVTAKKWVQFMLQKEKIKRCIRVVFSMAGFKKYVVRRIDEYNASELGQNFPIILMCGTPQLFGEQLYNSLSEYDTSADKGVGRIVAMDQVLRCWLPTDTEVIEALGISTALPVLGVSTSSSSSSSSSSSPSNDMDEEKS